MTQATICFLIKESNNKITEVLLAMKKKGFGVGKWNGTGGKTDYGKEENIEDTLIRETKEEIGVTLKNFDEVAELNFVFPDKKEWNQLAHVFLSRNWAGEIQETEEMKPQWFKVLDIPYNDMFPSDIFWLPKILTGKKIKSIIVYDNNFTILDQVTDTVDKI